MNKRKYSVLLLYPDYLAENYGKETYFAWVEAIDERAAVDVAQREAAKSNKILVKARIDFLPLAVFLGHQEMLLGVYDFA